MHDTCVHKPGVCGNSTEREVNQEIKREYLAFQGKKCSIKFEKNYSLCVCLFALVCRETAFSHSRLAKQQVITAIVLLLIGWGILAVSFKWN